MKRFYNYRKWVKNADKEDLEQFFNKIIIAAGFEVLQVVQQDIPGKGYSKIYLLAEGHLAVHIIQNKTFIQLSSLDENKYLAFRKYIRFI